MFCQQHGLGLAVSTFQLWPKNYDQANSVIAPEKRIDNNWIENQIRQVAL